MTTLENNIPVPIRDQVWPEETAPIVTIICATYNHEPYIRECIEGFLMQETSFPVEIIIRDDCSTDGTTKIIREYEAKYPQLVRPIYETENQYSKGIRPTAVMLKHGRGMFIAMCEGDDYWLDPGKLQRQRNAIEDRPDVSLVFTDREVISNDSYSFKAYRRIEYTTADLFSGFVAFTQTMFFRNFGGLDEFLIRNSLGVANGDMLITYYCSLFGPVLRLPRVTACYRRTGEGVWSHMRRGQRIFSNICGRCRFCERFGLKNYEDLAREIRSSFVLLLLIEKGLKKKWKLCFYYKNKINGSFLLLFVSLVHFLIKAMLSKLKKYLLFSVKIVKGLKL